MAYMPTGTELIDPFAVLAAAGVRNGMTVADFGCGTLGHYVFPAGVQVGPKGRVLAIDILKSVLSAVESRKKMESANNIETIWGDMERPNGVKVPDGTVDVGMIINNLYLSKLKKELVTECVRMVKPGGTLVVVDWKLGGAEFGPPPESRVDPEVAKQMVLDIGLTLEKEFSPGKYHWGYIFKKPA